MGDRERFSEMKHAVIMLVHNNMEVVKSAMRILDDERYTFYLHVDKKTGRKASEFIPVLKYAHCVEIPSIVVNWAGYSMVRATLNLIEAALKDGAEYIHCFQGADIPLKTPEMIDCFFKKNKGENFICFQPERYEFAKYKACCKHFFVDLPSYRNSIVLKVLNHVLARMQMLFVNKKDVVYHSSGLFSITEEFAEYIVARRREIRKRYRFALAADELFICNLFMESPYVNSLWNETKDIRLIDWKRREGNSPRTFLMEDEAMLKDAIIQGNIMFARKFSQDRDIGIVHKIEEMLESLKESI